MSVIRQNSHKNRQVLSVIIVKKPSHKHPECCKLARDRAEGKVEKDKKKPYVKKVTDPQEEDSEEEDELGQEFVNAVFDGPDFQPPAASERSCFN